MLPGQAAIVIKLPVDKFTGHGGRVTFTCLYIIESKDPQLNQTFVGQGVNVGKTGQARQSINVSKFDSVFGARAKKYGSCPEQFKT